jgi:hypothetical protein
LALVVSFGGLIGKSLNRMRFLGATKAPLCHHHGIYFLEDSNTIEKIQYLATKSMKKD